MTILTVKNEQEMLAFGKAMGSCLPSEVIIGLSGELGAGKTTVTKGVSVGLGIMEPVSSPTYSIMNEYEGVSRKLYHIDLYRINTTKEMDELELESLISPRTNMIIEWIEKLDAKWLKNLIHISISHNTDDDTFEARDLSIDASSDELRDIVDEAIGKFKLNYKH